jgi:hypothetical protein
VSFSSGKEIPAHHAAWLSVHPHRSEQWLAERIRDGFDVHHLDGQSDNNDAANLVLIEHTDHMAIHGGRTLGRLSQRGKKKGKKYTKSLSSEYLAAKRRADELHIWINHRPGTLETYK